LFQSPWILQLLAGHYDNISGAIRILELEQIYFDKDDQALVNSLKIELATLHPGSKKALEVAIKLDIMRMYPRGALALCVMWYHFIICLARDTFLICLIVITNSRSSTHWMSPASRTTWSKQGNRPSVRSISTLCLCRGYPTSCLHRVP